MECMKKLLEGFEGCGEAAAFYRGQNIMIANKPFADIFERDVEACSGLPIMEICHNESMEMIRDYIRRRAHDDRDVPTSYDAVFKTPSQSRLPLNLTIIKMQTTEDAILVIVKRI